MNWIHLRAMLWLRWRILANRVKRTGKLNNVFFGVLIALGLCASLGFFVTALALGVELLPDYMPMHFMATWGVLALGFLVSWMIGLVTDLQRSDAMSFKNLLHLPVSLGWIFLFNYLGSFVSLSVAIFLPAMLGLCLAMVIVNGPLMLLAFPLVLGFFGMITALTYQLRGWLARMMEDKRRGRNIIAGITVGFVLLLQVPNLLNLGSHSSRREERAERSALQLAASEAGPDQVEAQARLDLFYEEEAQEEADLADRLTLGAKLIPVGWLPYGMQATYERRWFPGSLCVVGLFLITGWSLRRSYRKTLASVVGAGSEQPSAAAISADALPVDSTDAGASRERKTLLVQRTLPFASEREAGIAFASLRSLLRAPEVKMLLMSPVILLGLFGVMLARSSNRDAATAFAPMLSLGAITMGLLSIMQLIQNQFGLDREGFRVFVLSPAPRRQILLGKNLATAPLAIGIGLAALIGLEFFAPAGASHFLGACFQLASAFMLLCMVGNLFSIVSPMRLQEHGLKAANSKVKAVLWQFLVVLLVPITLSPLLIPAGMEYLLRGQEWAQAFPLFAVLHVIGSIGIWFLYRWVLGRQGELLQSREQHILEVLTHD